MLAAGVSTSFVSCVDTEEPDSIVTLRNAKAEEVKAQAAKINAEVTDLLGRLELDKSTRALADEATKLANARKEAQNAYDKAIEDIQLAQKNREEDAAKATADFELQEAKATAEANLKTALAQLESAKTALTQAQNNATKDVEAEQLAIDKKKMEVAIETAQFKEWGLQNADGTYQLKGAKDAYVEALDALSEALKALKKSIANLEEDNIETITDKIEECEKTIADAQEGKAEFDALCKANDIQKWVTKYAELDKKINENDQNPEYTQLKYDRKSLQVDLKKLNEKIAKLKDTRDGYVDPESDEKVDGLVDELEEKMVKTEEAENALVDYLNTKLTLDIVKPVNNELKGILVDFDMDELIDGNEFKWQVGGPGSSDEELPTNGKLLDNEQKELKSLKEQLAEDHECTTLNYVISDLYQSIRKVEEALKELAAAAETEDEDKFIDVVTKDKTGLVAKWEGARTAYMDEDKNHVNEKLATAFKDANAALFGKLTVDATTTPDPDDVDVWEIKDVEYMLLFNGTQPLAVLPATWDAENEKIDVTPLMKYAGGKFEDESEAKYFAKNHLGRYGQYLAIMEKRAKKAEFEEAKAQAQAIYDEIFAQLDAIPTTAAELAKAIEDAFAEDKVAQADLIKQIEDIDAQILEKDEEKTLAETEEDVAAEDGTLIKERKDLEDKIAAKNAEEAEKFDVSKETALRDAILTFGLKLNLFTLDDEGNVQVDEEQVEVAYDEANREDFEKAYQATIDYYNNAIESTQEDLKYYQGILKAFQDKISGANTAADDKDVNKAIDFDFSSKALKEFFASDGIEKNYAELIEDVEAKQTTVKEKEEALEKAEADYNFYKKAYGVDKAE